MNKSCTYRLNEETMKLVNVIAEHHNVPKGYIVDVAISILDTYFTEGQIAVELSMMKKEDGRTTRWKKDLDIEAGFPI